MKIPNIFFACYFGGRPFDLINYLAIRSAAQVNQPEKFLIYLDTEPEGPWWQKAKEYLTVVKITPPAKIFGRGLPTPAHQADIVRLEKLLEHGGVYLDLDILCHKPFAPLFKYPFVLGKEEIYGKVVGLCNAVILSEPNALFAQRWLEGFDPEKSYWKGYRSNGNDKYFTELGVKYPHFLSTIFPEELQVEERTSFYYPSHLPEEMAEFFETDSSNFEQGYCHHLWARSYYEKYLLNQTAENIKSQKTAFARLAARFL